MEKSIRWTLASLRGVRLRPSTSFSSTAHGLLQSFQFSSMVSVTPASNSATFASCEQQQQQLQQPIKEDCVDDDIVSSSSSSSRGKRLTRAHFCSSLENAVTTTTVNTESNNHHRMMDYVRGWAWQQAILGRRLHLRRSSKRSTSHAECGNHNSEVYYSNIDNTTMSHHKENDGDDTNDADCILFLEHSPVYTLGRGADVNHLTFLSNGSETHGKHDNQNQDTRYHALSRSCRGEESARLVMNRAMNQYICHHHDMVEYDDNDDHVVDNEMLIDAIHSMVTTSMCEPVYAPNGVPIYRVERGGEVTFHGPGQLVVYPLLDLKRPPYQTDLHWYVRGIEQVIMECLKHYQIHSCRDPDHTGVWVNDDQKIAAIGVSASRWITTHGFAINVCPDLQYFDTSMILPCGIPNKGVTSMAKVLQDRGDGDKVPSVAEVASVISDCLEQVFGIQLQPRRARIPDVTR